MDIQHQLELHTMMPRWGKMNSVQQNDAVGFHWKHGSRRALLAIWSLLGV